MPVRKNKVLFVGSFKEFAKDGSVGGQMFASRTLINSDLKNEFEFLLIDSTSDSVPAPPVYKRFGKVIGRFLKLIRHLVIDRPDSVLIFSSARLSLLEKGLMALVSKIFFSKVIFAPRSGLIKNDVQSSGFYKFIMKTILSISDVVICQGTNWENFYNSLGNYNIEKFIVIPNWIDTSIYFSNRPEYRNQPLFARQLIYIGWIVDYKGIFDLLNAIGLIKSEICELTVSIYGSGKMINEAKELCLQLGLEDKVFFRGWANMSMKLSALSEADIYILPSHAEGFPNALIEAMASGIPSIATDVGGVSEVIIHNETGLLVEPGKPDQLAQAILVLYKNPALRYKFSKNGKLRVENFHSLETMYKKMKLALQR
ncbi:MAG: glycosyltransferase family 4 protein [Ferruginibacter sp.]